MVFKGLFKPLLKGNGKALLRSEKEDFLRGRENEEGSKLTRNWGIIF